MHVGPGIDYLERAFDASKYGEISPAPYLDITFPSVIDPALAPAGRHVMSVLVQYTPYALRNGASWAEASQRETLTRAVMAVLEEHAPGIGKLVKQVQLLTALDLEQTYGLTGGHIHRASWRSTSCSRCGRRSGGRTMAPR